MKLPDKQKLIELFFKIGWSDKNLSGEENKLIVSLSKRLGFTEPEILRTRNHIQATYKAPKENEIADIKFDGKKSLKSISRKKYLNTLKNEQAIEAHKLLSENTLYYFLNKKYQKIEESDKFFLTAYLGLSFSFILTDDVIYEKEILYVKSHLKTWFELGDVHDELINMSSYLASNKNECFDSNNASLYAKVLAFFLDHEERIKFINSLFNLAYSDDEVHPNELKLIYEVAKVLELNGDLVANIKTESLGIEGSFKIIRADDPNLAK